MTQCWEDLELLHIQPKKKAKLLALDIALQKMLPFFCKPITCHHGWARNLHLGGFCWLNGSTHVTKKHHLKGFFVLLGPNSATLNKNGTKLSGRSHLWGRHWWVHVAGGLVCILKRRKEVMKIDSLWHQPEGSQGDVVIFSSDPMINPKGIVHQKQQWNGSWKKIVGLHISYRYIDWEKNNLESCCGSKKNSCYDSFVYHLGNLL